MAYVGGSKPARCHEGSKLEVLSCGQSLTVDTITWSCRDKPNVVFVMEAKISNNDLRLIK